MTDEVAPARSAMEPPGPEGEVGARALRAIFRERSVFGALKIFHQTLGDCFRITLPGFMPVMLAGPEGARFVLVQGAHDLRWRNEGDPVVTLLRHGVLIEDGEDHDVLRRLMDPTLHRRMLASYETMMVAGIDQVSARWQDGTTYPMLREMRRAALLILNQTLFGVDFRHDVDRLWAPILKTLKYISPGPWIMWRDIPRPGYEASLRAVDEFLYRIIRERRADPRESGDLLSTLIDAGLDDRLIRDQLLTMLIAGHDTSTATLGWTLWLLGSHPDWLARVRGEVDAVVGGGEPRIEHLARLPSLDQVVKESLRLYPPIHIGNRRAAVDLEFNGYQIPAGTRVVYSIYLTHRDRRYWEDPEAFKPERFAVSSRELTPYTYLPFGGGKRNCIGFAFAEVEVRLVIARMVQQFDLELRQSRVRESMGATLEPRPGVRMAVRRR